MNSTPAPSDLDRHEKSPTDTSGRFRPLLARTRTIFRPVGPVAYDCVKLIFVRAGSAVLLSEFGEKPATTGDVVMLGANTLCGSEPEGSITVTTLYLDRDYVLSSAADRVSGTCRGTNVQVSGSRGGDASRNA